MYIFIGVFNEQYNFVTPAAIMSKYLSNSICMTMTSHFNLKIDRGAC